MGNSPTKAADNIYCKCRKEAAKYNEKLNSREGAAELLGLSVSSLSDYELGNTKVVPVDKVVLMADLYNAPELKTYYCRDCCPLGASNPKVVLQDLDRIVVRAVSRLRKLPGARDTLLNIVEDGVVTDEEQPDLNEVLGALEEIAMTALELKLWVEKNGMNVKADT
jgi:transcriptional regulator with XRE-family HTH domain